MQNSLHQLDLFGMPVETQPQPKRKDKAIKAAPVQETIAQPEVKEPVEEPALIAQTEAKESVKEPVLIAQAEVKEPVQELVIIAQPVIEVPAEEPVIVEIKQPVAIERVAEKSSVKKIIETKAGSKRGRKSFKEMDNEADLVEVPDDDVLQQKLYYSISEVAGWFKVNTSLLRYWENEFDILQPRKTRKGDRLFRVEDIKNLQLIYFLLRQRKFSIDGAKNYLKNNKQEADTQARLVESLTKFRSFLLELKTNL